MQLGILALCLAGALGIAGCDSADLSTREVELAAVQEARQRLGLAQDVPLKAKVWIGREIDGKMSFCGSVESEAGASSQIQPQQFAAHGDPLTFFIFGDAHQVRPQSQMEMFENWTAVCAGTQAA